MTFEEWYENLFVAGNIRGREPMFLHDRDRVVATEAWNAALKYANTDDNKPDAE